MGCAGCKTDKPQEKQLPHQTQMPVKAPIPPQEPEPAKQIAPIESIDIKPIVEGQIQPLPKNKSQIPTSFINQPPFERNSNIYEPIQVPGPGLADKIPSSIQIGSNQVGVMAMSAISRPSDIENQARIESRLPVIEEEDVVHDQAVTNFTVPVNNLNLHVELQ